MITFAITRTSLSNNEKPHEKAYKKTILTVSDFEREAYLIDFKNTDELLKFIEEEQPVVIEKKELYSKDYLVIELYDDWRE